jgi:primosomal protein N' (replication factor Y)
MVAKVILNNREHNIDRCFDYIIPDGMVAYVGSRVIVPFGFRNFSAKGIIIDISQDSDFENLKPIKKVIDPLPLCSKEILDLCLWIKEKYFCFRT